MSNTPLWNARFAINNFHHTPSIVTLKNVRRKENVQKRVRNEQRKEGIDKMEWDLQDYFAIYVDENTFQKVLPFIFLNAKKNG